MKSDRQNVLLVHPLGYQAGAAGGDIARFANIMPPIGLASLVLQRVDQQYVLAI